MLSARAFATKASTARTLRAVAFRVDSALAAVMTSAIDGARTATRSAFVPDWTLNRCGGSGGNLIAGDEASDEEASSDRVDRFEPGVVSGADDAGDRRRGVGPIADLHVDDGARIFAVSASTLACASLARFDASSAAAKYPSTASRALGVLTAAAAAAAAASEETSSVTSYADA